MRELLAALMIASPASPAQAQGKIASPIRAVPAAGTSAAGAGAAAAVKPVEMNLGLSLPPSAVPFAAPSVFIAPAPQAAPKAASALFDGAAERKTDIPLPVRAAREKAAAGEAAARGEMGAFLRRAIAVRRRDFELKAVVEKIRSSEGEEKKIWIAKSNALQDLPLEALIETYYPRADALNDLDAFLASVREAEVTINIDPTLKLPDGGSVLDGLLRDGEYKNYSETGVTQGLATKRRAGVEDLLFGLSGARPQERPKYAALNLSRSPAGAAGRYSDFAKGERGVYLALKDGVKSRSTITARDTLDNQGMSPVGTFEKPAAALKDMDREKLLALYLWELGGRTGERPSDAVNPEVQIFGEVRLDDGLGRGDVKHIAAHPSYRGTPVETALRALAGKYALKFLWLNP